MRQEIEALLTGDTQATTLLWIHDQLVNRGCVMYWRVQPSSREFVIKRGARALAIESARSDTYSVKTALVKAREALEIPPRRPEGEEY